MSAMEEMRVGDVMTREVETVSPDTTIVEFSRLTAIGGFASAPVLDRTGRLVGIVSRADVVRAFVVGGSDDSSPDYEDIVELLSSRYIDLDERRAPRRFTYVEDIMVRDVTTTTPDATVVEAARAMYQKRIHRLPVLKDGRLVGIITTFDLMRYLAGAVGDRGQENR